MECEAADRVSDAAAAAAAVTIPTPESLTKAPLYEIDDGFVGTDTSWALSDTALTTTEPLLDDILELAHVAPISLSPYLDLNSSSHASNNILMTPVSSTATEGRPYTPKPTPAIKELNISERIRANLDQVYFDHVHPIMPIVNERHYFSWAGQDRLEPGRGCLRSAMHTLAAAASSSFSSLSEALYAQTRQMLDDLDALDTAVVQLEHVQAGLFVAHHEYLRVCERRGMLTAGRAFRLVQMSRLHDMDVASCFSLASMPAPDMTFSEAEERRRTVWLAFALDRFLSARNEWPLTLHEDMICIRLPAPETNFQNNQPIQMGYLPEAVAASGGGGGGGGGSALSPFAECVVLAALYGRCMNNRRLAHAAAASGTDSGSTWRRLEWLSANLDKRIQRLAQASPAGVASLVERDPLLAFAHMLIHSSIIHLYHTAQTVPFEVGDNSWRPVALDYEQRAYRSAGRIAQLAEAVSRLDYSKVHPFSPNALSSATMFLMTRAKLAGFSSAYQQTSHEIEQLFNALRSLKDANVLARDLLWVLEADRCARYDL
ncbi:hypothetical protein LZ31DRAFT_632529 [Colletotrichum somersetense]|nr:hypothetical protein LZ31DRAFT_632529 [Colletotrichum somersetense]